MRTILSLLLATALLPPTLSLASAARPDLPMPQTYVDDQAGVISPEHRQALNGLLQELEQKTGIQYIILTVDSTGGLPIEQFSIELLDKWKLGQAGKDNGFLFTLAIQGPDVPLRSRLRPRGRHHGPIRRTGRTGNPGAQSRRRSSQPGHLRREPADRPADRRERRRGADRDARPAPHDQLWPRACAARRLALLRLPLLRIPADLAGCHVPVRRTRPRATRDGRLGLAVPAAAAVPRTRWAWTQRLFRRRTVRRRVWRLRGRHARRVRPIRWRRRRPVRRRGRQRTMVTEGREWDLWDE